jgi:DNA-binding beta-propeller fold protein YncE
MRSSYFGLFTLALLAIVLSHGCARLPQTQQGTGISHCMVDPAWPQKPARFEWAQMPGVAVDRRDQVYIFTRGRPAIQVYQGDGTFLRAWDMADPSGAHFVRIDPPGNVWVADIQNHVVCKYSPEGKLLLTLGQAGRAGADETHFDKPTDMVILPAGDIFVSDGYGNRRIVHFDAKGRYIKQWGEAGSKPGQFALPHSIVADSKGRLYVADRENARIQVFDTEGKLLAVWADMITPWGLHITKRGEIWVSGSSPVRKEIPDEAGEWIITPPPDQVVMKLNQEGKVLLRAPLVKTVVPPGKSGEVNWVHGIALDSQGDLYLTDIQGKRAQKFLLKP